jgi:hypothetical protein
MRKNSSDINSLYAVVLQFKDTPSNVYGIYDKKNLAYKRCQELHDSGNFLVCIKIIDKNESIDIEL